VTDIKQALTWFIGGLALMGSLALHAQTPNLTGQWVVKVDGDERQRALVIRHSGEALIANYGYQDQNATLRPVEASVSPQGTLTLKTPADSMVIADSVDDNTFRGKLTPLKGRVKDVTLIRTTSLPQLATVPVTSGEGASAVPAPRTPSLAVAGHIAPKIQMIYMGGNDCPPCVAWRGLELPKLEKTEAFKAIQYSFVTKGVRSGVPSSFFLPADVKPHKDKLEEAGAGNTGSAQTAILVNGEIFDYYFGTRSALEIEERLAAIHAGGRYPFTRCKALKKNNVRQCESPVPAS
jgi:hypothetical protein